MSTVKRYFGPVGPDGCQPWHVDAPSLERAEAQRRAVTKPDMASLLNGILSLGNLSRDEFETLLRSSGLNTYHRQWGSVVHIKMVLRRGTPPLVMCGIEVEGAHRPAPSLDYCPRCLRLTELQLKEKLGRLTKIERAELHPPPGSCQAPQAPAREDDRAERREHPEEDAVERLLGF